MNPKKETEQCRAGYRNQTALHILNTDSSISYLYQLNVPFQITYESCSGTGAGEYMNVLTLSGDEAFLARESVDMHDYIFRHRAPHHHDYFEFMLVLEGCVTQYIENREYQYQAGSACLINRSLCHKETFHSAAKLLFLGFSPRFLVDLLHAGRSAYFQCERQIEDTMLYRFIKNDLADPGKKAYLDFIPKYQNDRAREVLHRMAEKLIELLLLPKYGATFAVNSILCGIMEYLSSEENYHCTNVELYNNSDYLIFSRIEHLLDENHGRLSRTDLEERLNYSGNYLNRIVNKYTGMCLHDYAMSFCLKEAAYRLVHTKVPIGDIALELHFTNRTYFYRLFKERYGMTPKNYRKEKNGAQAGTVISDLRRNREETEDERK